jgi:hypothetical protein
VNSSQRDHDPDPESLPNADQHKVVVPWLRRTREARRSDPVPRISDLEVVCPDQHAAMEEAARRTRNDAADQVKWIYLRNAADQWVARRVQRHPIVEKEVRPLWKSVLESLLDALSYMWH